MARGGLAQMLDRLQRGVGIVGLKIGIAQEFEDAPFEIVLQERPRIMRLLGGPPRADRIARLLGELHRLRRTVVGSVAATGGMPEIERLVHGRRAREGIELL